MEEIIIKNKKYYCKKIGSSRAYQFTSQYHYSGVGFKKSHINLGIFRHEDELMVGVLQWGVSYQDSIKLNRYVKENINKEEYLELNRFSMADSEERNSESQAISLGIKWIKMNMPEIKLLVSYAGRKEGNYGYIYQATNWEYLGYFISEGFWFLDGEERHLATVWSRYCRYGNQELGFTEGLCDMYSDVRKTWTKQFIYIQRLDKRLTPAIEPLPYPKPSNEFPIKIREKIYIENNEVYENYKRENKEIIYFYDNEMEEIKRRNNKNVARYSSEGELIDTFECSGKINLDGFRVESIRSAISTGNAYKGYYFRHYDDEPLQEIDVPLVAIVDEIGFKFFAELARYLGISRQGVQQAYKRQAKKIKGKEVEWLI